MAVSGSTDFAQTATEIVEDARRKLGIHADEEPLQDHELTAGLRNLNRMLKAWQTEGIFISSLSEGSVNIAADDADYTFGSGGDVTTVPFEILAVRYRNSSSIDRPLMQVSRDDYYNLPNKASSGEPSLWYYDRQRAGGTLYIWPVPSSASGSLRFTQRLVIDDMDAADDDLDLPQEWYNAVVYNLAVEMMPEWGGAGTPEGQLVMSRAADFLAKASEFDIGTGNNSISILPDSYPDYR